MSSAEAQMLSFVWQPALFALMWLAMGGLCLVHLCRTVRTLRRDRRLAVACGDCGYPRQGWSDDRCPECGSAAAQARTAPRRWVDVPVLVVCWAVACWQLWYQLTRFGYILEHSMHRADSGGSFPGWGPFDSAYARHALAAVAVLWAAGVVFAVSRPVYQPER